MTDRQAALIDLHYALCKVLARRDPRMAREQTRDAAEEVCWTVLIMMGTGALDLPAESRVLLAEPMQKWADRAHA